MESKRRKEKKALTQISSITAVGRLRSSEADFLVRHSQAIDGAEYTPPPQIPQLASNRVPTVLAGPSRNKLEKLHQENATLLASLHTKEDTIDSHEGLLKQLTSEIATLKQSHVADLRKLESKHERELLRLSKEHAEELSLLSVQSIEPAVRASSEGAAAETNKHLAERAEELEGELTRLRGAFADERRDMKVEASARLLAQEREARAELAAAKEALGGSEDTLADLAEQLQSAQSKVAGLSLACQQLEQGRREDAAAQNKLRAELKALQLSTAAAYKGTNNNKSVGAGAGEDDRLSEAHAEARARQLQNMVDFLKAQVAAEQQATREQREASEGAARALEELRAHVQATSRENEAYMSAALEDAERRVESRFLDQLNDLASARARLTLLTSQLQEAQVDAQVARDREESARGSALKTQAQLALARQEADRLSAQLQEARQQREHSSVGDVSRQTQEAAVRRLDNEKQYLKSQLGSEVTLKNELQAALASSRHQLADVQAQWAREADELREAADEERRAAVDREGSLERALAAAQSEGEQLGAQNTELRGALTRLRDQVRVEQYAAEALRTANKRLAEELETSREETARVVQGEAQAQKEHARQLEALRQLQERLGSEHAADIARYKTAIARLHGSVSAAKEEALAAAAAFDKRKVALTQERGAALLFGAVLRVRRNRLAAAFRCWSGSSQLVEAARQFRGKLEGSLHAALAAAQQARDEELEVALDQQLRAHEEAVVQVRLSAATEARQRAHEFEAHRAAALERAEEEHARRLEEAMGAHEAAVERVRGEGAEALAELRALRDAEVRLLRADWEDAAARLRENSEAAVATARLEAAEETAREWAGRLAGREVELEEDAGDALRAVRAEHEAGSADAARRHEAALADLREQLAAEARAAMEALAVKFQGALAARGAEWERASAARTEEALEQLRRRHEQALSEAAEASDSALLAVREQLADEAYDALQRRDAEWRGKLSLQEEAVTASLSAEKQRAVQLEASKWQQTLREAEAAFALEAVRFRREGWAERDLRAGEEAAAQRWEAEAALSTLEDRHRARTEELQAVHQAALLESERALETERGRMREEVGAAKAQTRASEEAYDALQQHLRLRESELGVLRGEAEAMRRAFEEVSRTVADKDKRIRAYARRLQEEVEAERAASELRVQEARLAAEKSAQTQWAAQLAAQEREAQEGGEREAGALREEHARELQAALAAHELSTKRLREEVAAKLKQALGELARRHAEELDARLAAAREEGATALAQQREAHEAETVALRRKAHEAAEARVRELREVWEDEQFDALKQRDRDFQTRLQEELARAAEDADLDRVRALRNEAAKWQALLREAEGKLELAVQLAKASGWEEWDRQAREEVAQLDTRLALVSQRSLDVDDELEGALRRHEQQLAELRAVHATELDRSVEEARTKETQRCEAEWAVRLHAAASAHQEREGALREAAAGERAALEQVRVELAAQAARMAHERTELLEKVRQAEGRVDRLREAHASERAEKAVETESERLLRDLQTQRAHKEAMRELQSAHDRALDEAEARWDAAADQRVQAEVAALTAERQEERAAMLASHDSATKLLESMLRSYRADNAELTEQLRQLTAALEEAEDRCFDEQQRGKELAARRALSQWTAAVAGLRMQERAQTEAARAEQEAQTRLQQVQTECLQSLSEMTLAAVRMSLLVQAAETSRRRTHAVLTTHKAEVLVERRSQMRQFEKELQRMGNERAALEGERARAEEEVGTLSQQVADLEEQIYEHNRSSAMQNGRINVTHVRKKRRLDSELERLLELVEIKRGELGMLDERITAKSRQRDEKELSLVELERDLVRVLLEQQRLVLSYVDEDRLIAESCGELLEEAGLPWPPPAKTPTLENALALRHKREKQEPEP